MEIWLQVLLQSISLFILIFFLVRLMGKKSIARMTAFSFVNYIVVAVLAAMISANMIPNPVLGIISLGVWVLLSIGLDYLSLKSKLFHDLINGRETVLIKHGKIMEENLSQARLTGEDLLRELRSKNAMNLMDVEFAIMETTGEVNVYLKSDKKPVTAHDLGKKVALQAEPQTVILEGKILNEPLFSLGLNKEWLSIQLEKMGVSLDNVFLGQLDSSGDLYIDLYDDSIALPQPRVKEMIYANLEKCQADLLTYSMETNDENARQMYAEDAEKLKQIMKKLEPYLLR
ncbi:DUF421 domain-containing protein [Pseudoclostridium thermosuccinogenes]|uniref:DUF421 domain-containing protein n=1 Tax=Clostridium thermosuccinogenes TaxID=84032 RepID=UPI002FDAFF1D